MVAGERKPESSSPHAIETGGDGRSNVGGPSLFTCPRCRRQFHRSFLERFWSEWSRICAAFDGSGYRLDCVIVREAEPAGEAPVQGRSEWTGEGAGAPQGSEETSEIIGACLGDCSYCGDHNRIAIVTSRDVVSRCLRCRDEAILTEPPPWCRLRHSARRRQLGNGELSQPDLATGQPGASRHSGQ